MTLPGILHLTDTLEAGGGERVAVNLANLMPRNKYRSYLCVTRREGPLAGLIAPDVEKICLCRKRSFDLSGLRRLVNFIRAHDIQLLHAHSTSLFLAIQASLFPPYPQVLWHDHSPFGKYAFDGRTALIYRLFLRKGRGVIVVNRRLTDAVQNRLRVPPASIWYVPNFVIENSVETTIPELPGQPGKRIVCVANLRQEKGHLTLIQAMAEVARHDESAHLLLVGAPGNPAHQASIETEIKRLGLGNQITLAGHQSNVPVILRGCNIGVLSSYSEGFPLSLVEYGKAGLAAVATEVGECPAILDYGRAGLIVPPRDAPKLAAALLQLLSASEKRKALGETLQERVNHLYTAESVLEQIGNIYETLLQ